MNKTIRIGIDVGGTFTHAVAIDSNTLELIAKAKVLTTHTADEGVAKGIVLVLKKLIEENNISPENINFIAHSTTQATNALLEGDVAPVGIIAIGTGLNSFFTYHATKIGDIKLSEGKYLKTFHKFIKIKDKLDSLEVKIAINELLNKGAEVIVVAEAFSVDNEENERKVLDICNSLNILATGTHEISKLYGLRSRTKTAVINASMLPKMVQVATLTEKAVKDLGISAPLMIMRSDGGVMTIEEMLKRPILTMLSGPAAGVAAAMFYVKISDGIFIEVGGTSSDISAIKYGKNQIKSAEVGGNNLYINTLDVRTVGVGGGSLVRIKNNKVLTVGPRSAHISSLKYAAFTDDNLSNSKVVFISPKPKDPNDYCALEIEGEINNTITPTCAANLLKLIDTNDCAYSKSDNIMFAFNNLEKKLNVKKEELAKQILEKASSKCELIVKNLIKDYKLDLSSVTLVGGGGGAASIVPYLAKKMGLNYSIAPNSDVISAIGVALALIRETVERTVISPTPNDILKIRKEVEDKLLKMGVVPNTIEIQIEIDSQKNILRAIGTGSIEIKTKDLSNKLVDYNELKNLASLSLKTNINEVVDLEETEGYFLFGKKKNSKLFKEQLAIWTMRVIDKEGIIKLQVPNGFIYVTNVNNYVQDLTKVTNLYTKYGDGGEIIPSYFIIYGYKLLDFSGLISLEQIIALSQTELEGLDKDKKVIILGVLSD